MRERKAETLSEGRPERSASVAWVDRLDAETTQHQSAPGTHQVKEHSEEQRTQAVEDIWLPPRDSNPDMLIQRLPDLLAAEFLSVYGLPQDLLSCEVVTQTLNHSG